jgi:hypothetical protein
MKTFIVLITAFYFLNTSCQRCFDCELKDSFNNTVKTESFCGDPAQADEYEAAGYICTSK